MQYDPKLKKAKADMVGKVITIEINNNLLESGSVVVLKNPMKLEICTVLHLQPSGEWVIMGQTFDTLTVGACDALCKLAVANDEGIFPLKFNQWDKSIKHGEVDTNKEVNFELVSLEFKSGKYMKICTECNAHYMGARQQPFCKTCCNKTVTAKILVNKPLKQKRPRIVAQSYDLQALLATAYEMGKSGKNAKQFNRWLQKQI